jgi:hypothetical protein
MSPCGVVNCKAFGPLGSLLTNRMTQLVTYGSVGGVGRKPGPYPAVDAPIAFCFHIERQRRRATDQHRSVSGARFTHALASPEGG